MTDEEAHAVVLAVVELFADAPGIDDDAAAKALIAQGVNPLDAELSIAIVPTVFARLVLRRLGDVKLNPWFKVADRTGRRVEYWFSEQPIYRAAAHVAASAEVHGAIPAENYQRTAKRSAELDAANALLNAGGDVADVVFSTLSFLRVSAEELGPAGRVHWWQRLLGRA
jgi:hypothetical protein